MKIPIPCNFGEYADCKGKNLQFTGVSWFKWNCGMEYTYFFLTGDKWSEYDFYTTYENMQPFEAFIPDNLLADGFIKSKGYPLKGRGFANGIAYLGGKTYIDFIMTSNYLAHIKVQCDDSGIYIPNGDIIFPPSWDSEEKQERAVLKSIKILQGKPLKIKPPESRQLSIFDFMN